MTRFRTLVLALALLAPAAGGTWAQGLLSNRSIHDELKVTPEQARKLAALPIEERRETLRRTWEGQRAKLSAILSPAQVKRFEQISAQNAGLLAFQMSPFRDRLKLTEAQAAKIQEIQDDLSRKGGPRAAMVKKFLDDPVGAQKAWEEDSKAAMAKAVAVLTDEQKATWADMTGPPFRVKFERPPAP